MKKLFYIGVGSVIWIATIGAACSQAIEKTDDGITWQAGVDGVKIDFDNAQHVRRIYSKVAQPVSIADRRGIQTATLIAEEKAKANIVRFLRQDVISGRAVSEVDATMSQSVEKTGTAIDGISTADQRNVVQGLTEFTASISTGTLNGVIVLESGYDSKAKEAWVVVGVSDKTIAASRSAHDMMVSPSARTSFPSATGAARDPAPDAPAEVRRNRSDF